MKLRHYQQSIVDQIVAADSHDLVQLATGAGKTPIIARLAEHYGHAVIVCHRNILIAQASDKLAACGIQHRILASPQTRRRCARHNLAHHGAHCINPRSTVWLVSIDTWHSHAKRGKLRFPGDAPYITLIDEAHHFAEANKWQALQQLVSGRCIGFTATPVRGDGQPLTREHGGFFDRVVQADGYSDNGTERLIAEGYLAEYRAFYAADAFGQAAGGSGRNKLEITEPALNVYLTRAAGEQTIVIYPRIANATDALEQFRVAGVKAAVLHSELPVHEIERVLDAFAAKTINVLIAVDMISEGFDVPDADVLILARVVKSFGLYRQLCGRVLRPRPGKLARIYDLNGTTIATHGLPSDPVDWNEIQRGNKLRNLLLCDECGCFFAGHHIHCPECGAPRELRHKVGRRIFDINHVAGELLERYRARLSAEEAERLRAEKQAEDARRWRETYILPPAPNEDTVAGRKCAELFHIVADELQKQLSPQAYNEFFRKHQFDFGKIAFYVGCFAPGNPDYAAQAAALYEKHK